MVESGLFANLIGCMWTIQKVQSGWLSEDCFKGSIRAVEGRWLNIFVISDLILNLGVGSLDCSESSLFVETNKVRPSPAQ